MGENEAVPELDQVQEAGGEELTTESEKVLDQDTSEADAALEEEAVSADAAIPEDDDGADEVAAETVADDDEPVVAEAESAEEDDESEEAVVEADGASDDEGAVVDDAEVSDEDAEEAEAEEPGEEEEQPEERQEGREWFVIHCYSGYENRVKQTLERRIESMGMKDMIFQVVVPVEEEVELRDGKRRTVERRLFPGYILVDMILTEESWYVVRNTPNVTGFVGMGNRPTPLTQDQVDKILLRLESDTPRVKVSFRTGQKVRITEGPFADFLGVVDEIYPDKGRVRIMVSIFGRETPMEVDFLQVERV